jgi:predicted transcriptional regulator
MYYDVLRLTEAEMKIMRAIWDARHPLKIADIAARLADGGSPADVARPTDRATLAEQLRRLAAKGAVIMIKSDNINYYISRFPEPLYNAVLLKNLKERRFGGSLAEMVRLLLCDMDLTTQEIDEVKEMIDRAKEDRAEERAESAESAEPAEVTKHQKLPSTQSHSHPAHPPARCHLLQRCLTYIGRPLIRRPARFWRRVRLSSIHLPLRKLLSCLQISTMIS